MVGKPWQRVCEASQTVRKQRAHTSSTRRKQRESVRDREKDKDRGTYREQEVGLDLKTHLQRYTSSGKALPPKGSTTFPDCTMDWRASVQIHEPTPLHRGKKENLYL